MQKKVLVLGTDTSIFTPIMAELIKHITFKEVAVESAGLTPTPVHPTVVKVLLETGIDASEFKAKAVNEFVHSTFDIVITTSEEARNALPILMSCRTKIHKEFNDPSLLKGTELQKIKAFRKLRENINDWLNEFLPRHRLIQRT